MLVKHTVYLSHHALSLKEMGAVPGGAFRTFCEPVYRMSISAHTDIHKTNLHLLSPEQVMLRFYPKPCWSMVTGAPPIEATASTRSRQLYLQTQTTPQPTCCSQQ